MNPPSIIKFVAISIGVLLRLLPVQGHGCLHRFGLGLLLLTDGHPA